MNKQAGSAGCALRMCQLARNRLSDRARTDAAGAQRDGAYFSVRRLVPHRLQIGIEAAVGLDVRVADVVTRLGSLAAVFAFLGHGFLRKIYVCIFPAEGIDE